MLADHAVQNPLLSTFLSKNVNIKILIYLSFCTDVKLGLSPKGRTYIGSVPEQVAEKNSGIQEKITARGWRTLHNRSFIICTFDQTLLGCSNQEGRDGHVARVGGRKLIQNLIRKT
jgi:hypothetical protein